MAEQKEKRTFVFDEITEPLVISPGVHSTSGLLVTWYKKFLSQSRSSVAGSQRQILTSTETLWCISWSSSSSATPKSLVSWLHISRRRLPQSSPWHQLLTNLLLLYGVLALPELRKDGFMKDWDFKGLPRFRIYSWYSWRTCIEVTFDFKNIMVMWFSHETQSIYT